MPDFGIFRGFNDKLFGDKLYAGQLPTQLGIIGSQEVSDLDPDAQAFFDRVAAATGTLSATERNAINTLVKQMKFDGIWDKMSAIYPMVGASAAACSRNLKSNNFNGAFTATGWTFASTGATPNGTSAFMDTNLLGNQLTNNNHHQSFYSRTNVDSAGFQIGAGPGFSTLTGFRIRSSGQINAFSQMSSFSPFLIVSNSTSQGLCTWSRTSSTSARAFMNTITLGTLTDVTSGDISNLSVSFYLGALNSGAASQFSPNECAFASIGDGLTDTQAGLFYNAIQAFQTTLGRQV